MRNPILVICLTTALVATAFKAHRMVNRMQRHNLVLASHLLEGGNH
jgi:hypothetical protein